ncbi:MAG TPA: HEAT repeat domain-containing protein, partial [Candidatus Obscuribacterales bacterium]
MTENQKTVAGINQAAATAGSEVVLTDASGQVQTLAIEDFLQAPNGYQNFSQGNLTLELKDGTSLVLALDRLSLEGLRASLDQAVRNLDVAAATQIHESAKSIVQGLRGQLPAVEANPGGLSPEKRAKVQGWSDALARDRYNFSARDALIGEIKSGALSPEDVKEILKDPGFSPALKKELLFYLTAHNRTDPAALTLALSAFEDPRPEIRTLALDSFASLSLSSYFDRSPEFRILSEAAGKQALASLSHPDPKVVAAACSVLRSQPSKAGFEQMTALLAGPQTPTEIKQVLISHLNSSSYDLKKYPELKAQLTQALLTELPALAGKDLGQATELLTHFPSPAVTKALIASLPRLEPGMGGRYHVIKYLTDFDRTGPQRNLDILQAIKLLDPAKDFADLENLIGGMRYNLPEPAVQQELKPILLGCLSQPDADLKKTAAELLNSFSLSAQERAQLRTSLLESLSRPNPELQQATIKIVGGTELLKPEERAEFLPALRQNLLDPNKQVRREAAIVLADFGDQASLPELRKMLSDEDTFVRETAVEALAKLDDTAPATLEQIVKMAQDKANSVIQNDLIEALGQIGNASVVKALLGMANNGSSYSIEKALSQIDSRDPDFRAEVVTYFKQADPAASSDSP